jgi:hypothetical protein
MADHTHPANIADPEPEPTLELEKRLRRDEARLLADEARLAADEKVLRANRLVARIAIGLGATLAIAVAGLTLSLFALNRDIDVVAKAAPKDNSVGTAALRHAAVTSDKLAEGAVTSSALADSGVTRADLAPAAIGRRQIAPRAVTAAAVRHDTLTGAQINERTLHGVASAQAAARARTAVTAGNARQLAGVGATAYLSKVMVVRAASATSQRGIKGPIAARCPAGMRIISGGTAVDGTSHGVAIIRSAPNADDDWVAVASAYSRPTAPWRLVVTAICAAGGAG